MSGFGTALAATAQRRNGATALLYEDRHWSYADLQAAAAVAGAELLASGVQPGDRIAVGFLNSPRLVIAVLAVLRAGAVLVPVNPAATADELLYIVRDAQVGGALVETGHAGVLRAAGIAGLQVWDELPAATIGTPGTTTVAGVDPATAALIIYTSGTTGRPKGAVLSHTALLTNLRAVAAAWRWTENDRLLLTLPCFHLHGLGLGLLASFLVGSSVVLRSRFVAEQVYGDLAQHGCTMLFGVPTMYNRLVGLAHGTEQAHDLRRMRLWVSGSAPLNPATFERFQQRLGYALMDRYGMTECGFVLSTPYDEARRAGVVGRPLPGMSVRLIDSDRADASELAEVADGAAGEIAIRGPSLFSGYWQRPEETTRAFLEGYLRSGDLAVREPDGQLRILGRRSVDIIKTRGFKVGAVEIEAVLQRYPDLQEVAVVGIADADQGERIVAVFTTRGGTHISSDDLRAYARQHLAPHKVPADFVEIDAIPCTGPGKFKKTELIERLRQTGFGP